MTDGAQSLRESQLSVGSDIDDLVLLRGTVEKWTETAAEAVYGFRHKESGSFLKDSKSDDSEAPHITSTARSYVALLYSDRARSRKSDEKDPPRWANDFARFLQKPSMQAVDKGFREISKADPVNTFDVAHLADFNQVSDYLKRFYGQETAFGAMFEVSAADPKDAVIKKLEAALEKATNLAPTGFVGEVEFEQDEPASRHYFATLHSLRALHALGVDKVTHIEKIVAGARAFAIEQSYYSQRDTHRQDSVRLAFAGCIYAIYEQHIDKDLCLAIVEALAKAQQPNGSWPATHPIVRNGKRPWHIASHEVALCLTWLYFQPKVPDSARPLLIEMMRKYLLSAVIPTFLRTSAVTATGPRYSGWQDDHTVLPDATVGWATAIVCHFLAGFKQVLDDWINRCIIEELGLKLATKRYLIDDAASDPSNRWARTKDMPYVWPDLPPHAWINPVPSLQQNTDKIANAWTDPSAGGMISQKLSALVLQPIFECASEQPRRDRCAGLIPGSPGTRKTSLVRNVAEVLRWPMVSVPASTIFERGFDMMEAQATRVFRLLNHLRRCVIFFDEFEEFFRTRSKSVGGPASSGAATGCETKINPNERSDSNPLESTDSEEGHHNRTIAAFTTSAMLPRLQDLHDQDHCLIFLATNHIEKLDSAIKRPGRFDFTITVEHPDKARLIEYLNKLPEKALKGSGLNDLEPKEAERIRRLVGTVIGDANKEGGALKFSVLEGLLKVRPSANESDAEFEKRLKEKLESDCQTRADPPQLENLS